MNYYQHIERAIIFIEKNLSYKIGLDNVAEASCLSKFHFHRVFTSLMGETAVNYIRKRRLSKASYDLLYTDKKILDIAYEYQFESPEAFSRSFKSVFKVTPKNYRRDRIERIIHEKKQSSNNSLSHIIEGITKKPEILEIQETKIIGYSATTSLRNNSVPSVLKLFRENAFKINSASNNNVTIGLYEKPVDYSIEKFSEDTELNFVYGHVVDNFSTVPDNMIAGTIPKGKYARFTHKGSVHSVRLSYLYIFGSWLPKSNLNLSMNPDFERFDKRFLGSFNERSEFDIFIAIV